MKKSKAATSSSKAKPSNNQKSGERLNTKETSSSPKQTETKSTKSRSQQKSPGSNNNKSREKLPSGSGNKQGKASSVPKKNEEERKRDEQYKRLEAYINESGLNLAFNIIFAELVAKQILQENFFTYTAMRLNQIGKEIEGMKTKEPMYIEKPLETNSDNTNRNQNQSGLIEGDIIKKETEDVFLTGTKNKNEAEISKDNRGNLKKSTVKGKEDLKPSTTKSKENLKQTAPKSKEDPKKATVKVKEDPKKPGVKAKEESKAQVKPATKGKR